MVAGYPDARYGELILDGENVLEFKEKARPKFRINRGFFVINGTALKEIREKSNISFEDTVLPILVKQGNVCAHLSDAWFHSVDTEADAYELEQVFKAV